MELPHILVGGGGHALVLAETLLRNGRTLLGFTDQGPREPLLPGVPWLGDDAVIEARDPHRCLLVNGLGSVGDTRPRRALFERFVARGYRFARVSHPSAVCATRGVVLGRGSQLLAGAVVAPGTTLGDNVLLNSRAVLEHGCRVGAHSHIASGAVVCGDCLLHEAVHVGAGAVILQGIEIGSGAVIAAGSAVTRDVEPLTLVAGVPATPKKSLRDEQRLA